MHSDPGTMGGQETGNATSQSEARMQDTSVVPGESAGPGSLPASAQPASAHSASTAGPYPSFHGRTVSWVAVAIMVVGFVVGGLGLVLGGHGGPVWWLFWAGAGVAVLGLLVSLATNMFEDWY